MIRKRRKRVEVQVPFVKGFTCNSQRIDGVIDLHVTADGYLNIWSTTPPSGAHDPVGGVNRRYNYAPGAWSYYIVTELE